MRKVFVSYSSILETTFPLAFPNLTSIVLVNLNLCNFGGGRGATGNSLAFFSKALRFSHSSLAPGLMPTLRKWCNEEANRERE